MLANFNVSFNGDLKGINSWCISLSDGDDTSYLNENREHALQIVHSVFYALCNSFRKNEKTAGFSPSGKTATEILENLELNERCN